MLYAAISEIGSIIDADTANKLIGDFQASGGVSADTYARGIVQAYRYGYFGFDMSEATASYSYSSRLTEAQRNTAFALGRANRKTDTARMQAARSKQKLNNETPETSEEGFCTRENVPNEFNPKGMTLEKQLEEILSTAESFDGRYLYIGHFTPTFAEKVKKYVAIEDVPILMNYRDAYLSMESKENGRYKGEGINYHDIGTEGLATAIKSLSDPEAIMLSKKSNKIELAIKCVDRKGKQMLAIVAVNTSAQNAGHFIKAHVITSIYGRRNMEKYIDTAETEDRVIYKKREESAQGITQVQYEGDINANSSTNSIRKSDKKVKGSVSFRTNDGKTVDFDSYVKKDGRVLNERQAGAVETMKFLSQAIGAQFIVYESYVKNGKRYYVDEHGVERESAPNGWYDPATGKIYVDLHAGNTARGTMLYTMAHELTHFIAQWSPEKFKALADIVFRHSSLKGTIASRVADKMARAKAKGRPISFEVAQEEVVADAMESVLKSGNVVEFIADVKQQDAETGNKLVQWFKKLVGKIKKWLGAYDVETPDSYEGKAIAEMQELLEELEKIFAEGLLDASANFQAAEKITTVDGGVANDAASLRSERIVEQIQSNLDAIMKLDNVYVINADNATLYTGVYKDDENRGREVFKEQGNVAERPGFGRVVLGRKGVVNTVFHGNGPAKQAAFPAIKSVIEKGIKIGQDFNHKDRGYDTVTFGAPVDFFGTKAPLGVVVQVFDNGRGDKSFYIHEICDAEGNYIELVDGVPTKKEISSTGLVDSSSTAGTADNGITPKTSIRNESGIVKTESAEAATLKSERDTFTKAAVEHFGRTYSWKETGYLLTDGGKLDFSGRHEGASGGYRTVDHREIQDIYPADTELDGNGAMVDFMRQGNIRIMPEGGGINLQVQPTKAQENALSDFISRARGEVILDIDDASGNTVISMEYPRGTHSAKILQDIRNYFETGAEPVVSTVAQFRYQERGYGGIREVLAKKGLDELSKRYGSYFPLSASFDATIKADNTPLVMKTVVANSVQRKPKETAFKAGRQAFANAYGIKTSVHIKQMGIDADLFPSVAGESIAKAIGRPDEQSTLDVIPHIRDILGDSILMGVERIAHTDNKGTALYGYRLYNLYWYQNGKQKTPNCLVCTVVQDLDKAEGYVFQNIENVTVGHGLPGNKTGMPTPSNGNAYTISQLYRAVKKIARNDGGLKYTDAEKNKYLFSYTERNDGTLYQERAEEATSNRSLLANALESAVTTDTERQKLADYRAQIARADELEQKLKDLNAQIRELSFAKGKRDTVKIRQLRDEAIKTANRITVMDNKLLRLEAAAPLQEILSREKKKAVAKESSSNKGSVSFRTNDGKTVDFDSYVMKDGRVLNERQAGAVEIMKFLSQAIGAQFIVYESYVKNGKRYYVDEHGVERESAPNGWYDPATGKIYVDLHAGNTARGTMLYTMAHELTHFIAQWSPEKFKALADIVFRHSSLKGTIASRVADKMARAKAKGRPISFEVAQEEVVADAMESVLKSGNVVEFIADVKQQDAETGNKLVQWFKKLVGKIKKWLGAYDAETPDSYEGKAIAEMKELLEELEKIFAEGLLDAGANFQAAEKSTTVDGGVRQQARASAKNPNLLDPRTVTEADVRVLLENVRKGMYDENTYIPVRISTPGIIQERLFAEDLPMAIPVKKVRQAFEPDQGAVAGKNVRGHGLSVNDLIYIIAHLDSPDYLYSQEDGRGIAVLKISGNTAVVVEFGNNINAPYMNGFEGGKYNISITAFDIDGGDVGLFVMQMDKGWTKVFDKQKEGDPAKKFQATRPFAIEQDTLTTKVTQPEVEVKKKDSSKSAELATLKSERDYSYDALVSKPDMVVTTVDGNVPGNRADVAQQAKQNAAKVGKFDPKTGSVSVHVDDIDTDVILSTKGLRHGLRRTQDPLTKPNYIVTVKAGEILKNAIRINEITPSDGNANSSYVLMGAARDAKGTYIVRFVVNHFDHNVESMDVLYAINAKKELAALNAPRLTAEPLSVTSSTISIAELLDLVNQYFPDILPEDVLKHYGYDARPEGDLGEDALYQERTEEATSNRSLLANALESAVTTDTERQKLADYRAQVARADELEQKLKDLNAQIRELSFAKGERDTVKIRQLRDEAIKTANRITVMDNKLLRLEAAAPLQEILSREKKKAADRVKKQSEEALREQMQKADERLEKVKADYRESRKKAIENRNRTEVRHKIQRVVKELNSLLNAAYFNWQYPDLHLTSM